MSPGDELRLAKSQLRNSVAAFDPLKAIRQRPLATVGVVCAVGAAAVGFPRTRRVVLDAVDVGLRTVVRSAVPVVRVALAARRPGGARAHFAAIGKPIRAGLRLVDAGLNYSRVDPPGPA